MKNTPELQFEPVMQFIKTVGAPVERYFGKDPACILYLYPHGTFYGTGLYHWLKARKKDVVFARLEDDASDLKKELVRGRKVLIVDGDVITGKAYKRSMEELRFQKEHYGIKDIKFATYVDRKGLADFSVWNYNAEAMWHFQELDAIDLKIISFLKEDGRMSFAEIAKKLRVSGVAVKNRVDLLIKRKVLQIQGRLVAEQFYAMSAAIQIDADQKAVVLLVQKLRHIQEVYHLVKRSGNYTLAVGILVRSLEEIESFVESQVRSVPGVRSIDVHIGEVPIIPKTFSPQL